MEEIKNVEEAKEKLCSITLSGVGVPTSILDLGFFDVDESVVKLLTCTIDVKDVAKIGKPLGVIVVKENGDIICCWLNGYKYLLGRYDLYTSGGSIPMSDVEKIYSLGIVYNDKDTRANGHFGCNANGEHEKCDPMSCGIYDNCKYKNTTWFER